MTKSKDVVGLICRNKTGRTNQHRKNDVEETLPSLPPVNGLMSKKAPTVRVAFWERPIPGKNSDEISDSRETTLESVHNLLDAAAGASSSDESHQRGPVRIQFVKVGDDESVWFCLPELGNKTETQQINVVLDAEDCLRRSSKSKVWQENKILLRGHKTILRRVLNEYLKDLKIHFGVFPSFLLFRKHVKLTDDDDDEGFLPSISFEILRDSVEQSIFERSFVKMAVPRLYHMEKAMLLTITRQGYVGLVPKDSFYKRIQDILKDNADLITDSRCTRTYGTFQYQYDMMKIKDFVARLDEKDNLPHRIRILYEYEEEEDDQMNKCGGAIEKREVSFIDLGIERKMKMESFMCCIRRRILPRLLQVIPSQMMKCQLEGGYRNTGDLLHMPLKAQEKFFPSDCSMIIKLEDEYTPSVTVIAQWPDDDPSVIREDLSLNWFLAHRATVKRKRELEGFKGASLRSTVNGFAKEFLNLINSETFHVPKENKCDEILPIMRPRRIGNATDEEDDPFEYLNKAVKRNGLQQHPQPIKIQIPPLSKNIITQLNKNRMKTINDTVAEVVLWMKNID